MKARFAAVALVMVATLVGARIAAPPPIALRVAAADVAFVGTVERFGDRMVPAALTKDDDRMMQVAEVTVSDNLLGKVNKKVKVYLAPGGRRPGVVLDAKDKALFMVIQHPTLKDVYVAEAYGATSREKDNDQFAAQVDEAKVTGKLLADPMKGLKSMDAGERLRTAGLLVTRYRSPRPTAKEGPLPAAESKLILQALSEADWEGRVSTPYTSPRVLFARLGITNADGWVAPADFKAFAPNAKKWLKDNAGTFVIKGWQTPAGTSPEP